MKNKDEAGRLRRELLFLYRIAQSVNSLEISELLQEIVKIATKATKGDSCLIYTLDLPKQELILRASKNPHPDLMKKIKMKLGEGITGWVAREREPVAISSGVGSDPRFKFFRNLPEDLYAAFLSVPILSKNKVIGVINIQHKKKHQHTKMEINLLSAIGKLVGGTLENALLIEETLILKEALELRKLLDRAKGILIKRKQISESEAYRILQKESMNRRISLKEVCEAVVISEKLDL